MNLKATPWLGMALGGLCLAALAAPGPAAAAGKKVILGEIAPIALFWPDFVAQKQGFYAKEGLDIDPIYVGAVAAAVQQVVAGSLDVADTTCETSIRAEAKGGDVTIIGEMVSKWPYSMMANPAIKTPQDLKGKKVILSTPKQDIALIWNQWLRDQGMQPGDVDQIFDGATPNRYAALVNGAVSVAAVSQPFDFRAMDEGYKQLVDFSFYAKEYSFVCIVARKSWLKDNKDTAAAYLRAISDAVAWLYDPKNKDAAIDILTATSKQNREIVAKTYDYYFEKVHPYSQGLKISNVGIRNIVDAVTGIGDMDAAAAKQQFYDTSFLPH
jgi:NitT/TauT family transport system substrate-binding protein